MLGCFEGFEVMMPCIEEDDVPVLVNQEIHRSNMRRFSSRHERGIYLNGVRGFADLEGINVSILKLLLAGEIAQIGKNTSFGFGRYTVL